MFDTSKPNSGAENELPQIDVDQRDLKSPSKNELALIAKCLHSGMALSLAGLVQQVENYELLILDPEFLELGRSWHVMVGRLKDTYKLRPVLIVEMSKFKSILIVLLPLRGNDVEAASKRFFGGGKNYVNKKLGDMWREMRQEGMDFDRQDEPVDTEEKGDPEESSQADDGRENKDKNVKNKPNGVNQKKKLPVGSKRLTEREIGAVVDELNLCQHIMSIVPDGEKCKVSVEFDPSKSKEIFSALAGSEGYAVHLKLSNSTEDSKYYLDTIRGFGEQHTIPC